MSNDDYSNHYLGEEIRSIDDILNDRPGMMSMITAAFYTGLGSWVAFANIIVLVTTALLIWCGYKFFTVTTLEDLVFWGICLIIALLAQVALKQWIWSQMDRGSLIREIKRLQRMLINQSGSEAKS